ncbi:hypothetical protein MTO96_005578 [Rhipicephalus appendiculatus]
MVKRFENADEVQKKYEEMDQRSSNVVMPMARRLRQTGVHNGGNCRRLLEFASQEKKKSIHFHKTAKAFRHTRRRRKLKSVCYTLALSCRLEFRRKSQRRRRWDIEGPTTMPLDLASRFLRLPRKREADGKYETASPKNAPANLRNEVSHQTSKDWRPHTGGGDHEPDRPA